MEIGLIEHCLDNRTVLSMENKALMVALIIDGLMHYVGMPLISHRDIKSGLKQKSSACMGQCTLQGWRKQIFVDQAI